MFEEQCGVGGGAAAAATVTASGATADRGGGGGDFRAVAARAVVCAANRPLFRLDQFFSDVTFERMSEAVAGVTQGSGGDAATARGGAAAPPSSAAAAANAAAAAAGTPARPLPLCSELRRLLVASMPESLAVLGAESVLVDARDGSRAPHVYGAPPRTPPPSPAPDNRGGRRRVARRRAVDEADPLLSEWARTAAARPKGGVASEASAGKVANALAEIAKAQREATGGTHLALDRSQNAAVCAALGARLSLIQGPPGTGKTRTACHAIAAALHLQARRAVGSNANVTTVALHSRCNYI